MSSSKKFSRKKAVLRTVLIDIALTGVGLLTFAYFHHVRLEPIVPKALPTPVITATQLPTAELAETPVPGPADSTDTEAAPVSIAADPTPEPTPAPTPVDTGLLGGQYAEKFTDTVVSDENGYHSPNVAIEITQQDFFGSNCIIADIYIKKISSFRTAVYDEFSTRYMPTLDMAQAANAILAVSGDFFWTHRNNGGFAIRNGKVYLDTPNKQQDCAVLYSDGTFACYKPQEIDVAAIEANYPVHVWCFGPSLLDPDGHPYSGYNVGVARANPRSSIGYYGPGHYCFIMVEGRKADSDGLTLVELAKVFESLGCTAAYNLDGGKTAAIVYNGELLNRLIGAGRDVSDILYIVEPTD